MVAQGHSSDFQNNIDNIDRWLTLRGGREGPLVEYITYDLDN